MNVVATKSFIKVKLLEIELRESAVFLEILKFIIKMLPHTHTASVRLLISFL